MNRKPETVDVWFCHVHGYAHERGEYENFEEGEPECHEDIWPVIMGEAEAADAPEGEDVEPSGFYTLKAGDLAYIYTVRGGLVPCKVLVVKNDGETEIVVTADRTDWRKGTWEILRNPWVSLVNRNQVSFRRGVPRISGALAMVTDEGQTLRHRPIHSVND